MNRENIQKVRDVIATLEPLRFNMDTWVSVSNDSTEYRRVEPDELLHDCGTCGCIGGWTNAVFNTSRGSDDAREVLGLAFQDAYDLFYPFKYRDAFNASPEQAVRVLDHLLATGKVDWSIIDATSPNPNPQAHGEPA